MSRFKDQNKKYSDCLKKVEPRSSMFLAHPSTISVHAGEERIKPEYSVSVPTFHTSTYIFESIDKFRSFKEKDETRQKYGRYGNPTQRAAEKKVADLEGAERGLMFSSGMAAITTALLALLKKGDHAIFVEECYKRTQKFAQEFLTNLGIETTLIPAANLKKVKEAIRDQTKLIFTESPTNPLLKVADLEKLAKIAQSHRAITLLDSTFATPYNQRPLQFDIDLVVHSGTKYLGGHNDLLCGFLAGPQDLVSQVEDLRASLGAIPDPHSAYLLIRGLKTFALRMKQHNANGLQVARFLESHPKVKEIYYPGLKNSPYHSVAKKQMRGFGGVVSFEVEGDVEQFLNTLTIPYLASSFGGAESLIEWVPLMSYYSFDRKEREALGIKENLIRFSVGIEDPEMLIEDLKQALKLA